MDLNKKLGNRKKQISAKWLDALLATYKSQGATFFKETSNEFANPVGTTFHASVDGLVDFLLLGGKGEEVEKAIDGIVRIRAVQGFSPSVATGFVFAIKKILQEEAGNDLRLSEAAGEWNAIESRIDEMTCMAFDMYMQCREKIWKHKANHLYNRTSKLLVKSGLIEEVTD